MNYLESMNCKYVIRAKGYKKLQETVRENICRANINPDHYTAKAHIMGGIKYKVGKSEKVRRVVCKVFPSTDKDGQLSLFPLVYCVITNQEEGNAKSIMDVYEARGASENFTKEGKNDFHAGTLSHKSFIKNEMKFLNSVYTYHLSHMFQHAIWEGKR